MSPASSKHQNHHSPRNSYYYAYQPHQSHSSSRISAAETDSSNFNPSDSESVIDRIKRRSFYCRFNEKKPKRASTIVGQPARDYYRDIASTRVKTRSSDQNTVFPERTDCCSRSKSATPINSKDTDSGSSYSHSPYLNSLGNNHNHYHSHYHSTPVTESTSKYSNYGDDRSARSTNNYLSLRAGLTSPTSSKTYSHGNTSLSTDYLLKGSNGTSTSPYLYASYNPKRRTSSFIAPTTTSSSLTRQPRAYDHRSISMLDSSALTPCSLSAERRSILDPHHCHHLRSVNDYGAMNIRYVV